MNILVTGATGFVGTTLVSHLTQRAHRVMPLRRAATRATSGPTWNPATGETHLESPAPIDAVVHLAGENIAQRWTPAARARIRASRVDGTRVLSLALARLRPSPQVLVCASATGFYGDRGDELLDEHSPPGTGFLAHVCRDWEAATAPAQDCGIRVVHLRLGIVLAPQGGALARMLPAFRLGLGGRLGNGRQYWSWIALEDLLRIVERALQDDRLRGPINAVAPGTDTNAHFTAVLARALHRPAFMAVPSFVVRAVLGDMGREALLASTRVHPARLLQVGFDFAYPNLDAAFSHVLAAGNRNRHH